MSTTWPRDGKFGWFEMITHDVEASARFYAELFGWQQQTLEIDTQPYLALASEHGHLAGLLQLGSQPRAVGPEPHWLGYVHTAVVPETTARAERLGATIVVPPTSFPGSSGHALLRDPQGALYAVITPQERPTEDRLPRIGEFCWHELHTADLDAAWSHYQGVFGWVTVDPPESPAVDSVPDRAFGHRADYRQGSMMAPAGEGAAAPRWLHYVEAMDLDLKLHRAEKLGATVVRGPAQVASGGRAAELMDPQGAPFGLHQALLRT